MPPLAGCRRRARYVADDARYTYGAATPLMVAILMARRAQRCGGARWRYVDVVVASATEAEFVTLRWLCAVMPALIRHDATLFVVTRRMLLA